MDKKKVTRRVAIGSAVGALAAAPLIIRALKGKYEVEMPSNSSRQSAGRGTATTQGTMTVNGYTIEVPPVTTRIEKPEDWDTLRALSTDAAQKALANDPGYVAHMQESFPGYTVDAGGASGQLDR
jgi:hypothetical protein